MKTILFPSDFSAGTEQVFDMACHMASHSRAKITVLHVIEMSHDGLYDPGYIQTAALEKSMERAKTGFAKLAFMAEEKKMPHLKLSLEVRRGRLVSEILKLTEEIQPNTILLGSSHPSGVGHTARAVLKKVDIPVLCVPKSTRIPQKLEISFVTNFRKEEIRILDKLVDFARAFNLKVSCIHIKRDDGPINPEKALPFKEYFTDEIKQGLIHFEIIRKPQLNESQHGNQEGASENLHAVQPTFDFWGRMKFPTLPEISNNSGSIVIVNS